MAEAPASWRLVASLRKDAAENLRVAEAVDAAVGDADPEGEDGIKATELSKELRIDAAAAMRIAKGMENTLRRRDGMRMHRLASATNTFRQIQPARRRRR